MVFKNRGLSRSLASLVYVTLVLLQPSVRQNSSESVAGNHDNTGLTGPSPTAFLIVDIGLRGEDGISLTWSDLGMNFVYAVEFSDSMFGPWDMVAPVDQWPVSATSWTGTSASGEGVRFYRIKTEALYDPPTPPADVTANLEDGKVVIAWSPVPGASSYNVYWSTDEKFTPLDANKAEGVASPFTHTVLTYDLTYYYVVTAVGNKGESEVSNVVSVTLVSSLDPTVATTVAAASEFLYTGDNPIQTGVAEGTIEPHRATVLRGKVMTRGGQPLSAVTVSVLSHPEFGQTASREDGMFDMAVNGGGCLALDYQKEGYLPAQRQVSVPWQDYVCLPDVVLIPQDAQVSTIDLSAPTEMQAARGSVQTDDDGTRQATILFPPGTQAEMVMPDGSTQTITTLNVRATEYTVSPNGPRAMPAELPPTSFYTYCVELSADEVLAAGANTVTFSQPLYFYVENFVGIPTGIQVPVGYYDRDKAAWVPSNDGRVIELLAVTGMMADLDTDGDSVADDPATLEAMGITDAERQKLAALYPAGQSLWRIPVSHFTAYDPNYGTVPPEDAKPPQLPEATVGGQLGVENPSTDPAHGVIEFENQIFREGVDIVGTPFSLNYSSDRVPGWKTANTLDIPLSGQTIPASAKRIELQVLVAGQRSVQSFPAIPNQSYRFLWDGLDVYGRPLQGEQPIVARIGYVYDTYYALPPERPSFGLASGVRIPGDIRARQEITLWQEQHNVTHIWDMRTLGLGGWTVSTHHVYDPQGGTLYLGDGRRRSAVNMNSTIKTIAGMGFSGYSGDGGPATEARLSSPLTLAFGQDGSLYVAAQRNYAIRRIGPDGIITTVAGSGRDGDSGDGGPAIEAKFCPLDVEVGPDGSLYIADQPAHRVRRVGPDGIINTMAGTGEAGYSGDGSPAIQAQLSNPFGIALAPDGSLYITDTTNHRIRRVGPDGIIRTVAGSGQSGYGGDGGPATQAKVEYPTALALGPDGSLYITENETNHVRRVGPDGIITTVAGNGNEEYSGDGGPATEAGMDPYGLFVAADGSLYIADNQNQRVRRVGPDGVITTVAGSGQRGIDWNDEGGPATHAVMKSPFHAIVGPDGSLYVVDAGNHRIRRVSSAMPGFDATDITLPSEEGTLVYHFNPSGRHLRTMNAFTGATVHEFACDAKNRLIQVTDGDGNVTTIERDANGNPTAIVSPFGPRTTLTLSPQGYLETITAPGGAANRFGYTDSGLLTDVTTSGGEHLSFEYDSLGRIVGAQGPESRSLTLERADTDNGHEVTVRTALGRITTYLVERLSTGAQHRLQVYPDNTRTDIVIGTDGARTTTLPDGTVLTEVEGPDPRFGMRAPILKSVTTTTPSGLTTSLTGGRTVVLSDPNDFLGLATLTDTVTLSGKTTTKVFDAATRTFTTTNPGGRTTSGVVDAQGRTVRAEQSGFEALRFAYDDRGRQRGQSMGFGAGARMFTLDYNDAGQIDSITDHLSRVTRFAYDASWRLTSHTFPDGSVGQFEHDANGFVTAITPPGRLPHRFVYTGDNAMKTYAPPQVGGSDANTEHAYDEDGQPTLIIRPDGQTMEFGYEASGRLETITLPSGVLHFEYDPGKGDLTRITSPDGGTVSFAYDGFLPIGETWAGTVAGRVERTFGEELRVASESVNGGHLVAYAYDDDGLLTQSGDLVLNWHSESAVLVGTVLGKVTDSWTYNAFGEPESYSASFNGADLYSYVFSYDKLGRLIQKGEKIQGLTTAFAYGYDLAGHLTEVRKDGEVLASYTYDTNSNRLTRTDESGTVSGAYDAQDRLLQYGPTEYTHTLNGELFTKTANAQTTTFTYDVEGNLRTVILPDGKSVEYLIDGRNRRVGKKVNGTLTQGFLYQTPLNVVAELNGSNAVVSRFVYGSRGNVPDYMVKGGATYRIVSDHLGSPRLVVNVAEGTVAQRMDYDEFGSVLLDTNPGFQPFGFAGGLYDPDTGLVRFGARDYDSYAGRWTAKDPIHFVGGDLNLYAYVFNNPVNLVDPEGLSGRYLAVLAALYDAQGRKEEAAELRSIDKAYGAFGRSEYKKYGFWKNQPACQQSASDLMKYLPGMANMQRFKFVRLGAGKQAPGAYAHNAAGLVDVKTNQLVAVLDPIVIGPLPGMQLMRRDFSQQYNPCEWATTRGLNYAPYGWGVGIDTVNQAGK